MTASGVSDIVSLLAQLVDDALLQIDGHLLAELLSGYHALVGDHRQFRQELLPGLGTVESSDVAQLLRGEIACVDDRVDLAELAGTRKHCFDHHWNDRIEVAPD